MFIFVNVYNTFFSSFFIVALSCLSFQVVFSFAFDFILILSRNFYKVNWITCARHDTRFISWTFVFILLNNRFVRNNRTSLICKIKLLKALSFVTTFKRFFNLCRTIMSCIIFANFCLIWEFVMCSKINKISW